MPRPPPPFVPAPHRFSQEPRAIARKPPAADAPPRRTGTTAAPRPRKTAANALPATALATSPGTPRKKAAAAGPGKPATPRRTAARRTKPDETTRLDELQKLIVASLEDDKAEQVVAIDLAGRAAFADRMVIATGLADRQISAMATHLEEALHKAGVKRVLIEGAGGSEWVLIDAGDIIIHLFKPEARSLYALERMWSADLDDEAPPAPLVFIDPAPEDQTG